MSNLYNIDEYTDAELYNILDLVDPSDRVLEARIIQLIHKYQGMNSEPGQKFTQFFKNMYNHFFYDDNSDDEISSYQTNNTKEGFQEGIDGDIEQTTPPQPPTQQQKTQQKTQPPLKVSEVKQIEYTRDYINPLLKQTTKRIISIDSQYRDMKFNQLSTNFTFNLSEPLTDVVALRLYSIQIPYSWNTINNDYGGNFFYLKGISPGIDNGNFDYQIDISSGNYLPNDLINTINNSFNTTKQENTDVSFGLTEATYNQGTNLTTFNIDITNIFNETNYQITFNNPPSYNPFPESTDFSNNQLRYKNNNNNNNNYIESTLSAFLGFNDVSYCPNTIYSKRDIPYNDLINNIDNTDPSYYIDESNNYFTIYQYIGPKPLNQYFQESASVKDTIIIKLSLTGYNTRNNILKEINNQLKNNPKLINSKMERIQINDPSGNYIDSSGNYYKKNNNGNSYFSLSIQLNKKTTLNSPNLKTVVIFPDEINTSNRIWVDDTTVPSCCFKFKNKINELNTIKAESNILQSSYIINNNTYFVLKCITPGYDLSGYNGSYNDGSWNLLDNSCNDYKITIPNSDEITGYDLNQYISTINTAIKNTNDNSKTKDEANINGIFNLNTMGLKNNLDISNNLLFRFDINKKFTTNSYSIDLSNTILYKSFSLGEPIKDSRIIDITTIDLSNINNITSKIGSRASYSIDASNIIVIKPNTYRNETNKYAPQWKVPFIVDDVTKAYGLFQFIDIINNSLNQFSDISYSYPLIGSKLTCITRPNGKIIMTLNIVINKILTQYDYQVIFYDLSNSWSDNFNLDSSYSFLELLKANTSYSEIEITGITQNNFYLKENATFTITPITNGLTINNGLNNNIDPIIITIPAESNFYTIGQIQKIINDQFDSSANQILNGSYLDINDGYVSISMNINKIYTAKDFKLVFYDFNSFVKCFVGSTSVRNVSWDSTLGWILGFHNNIEYFLNDYLNSNNIATLTGDTKTTINLYNYFLIVLDDYTQSHLNDGLITLTPQENDINVPPYAPKSTLQCNPDNIAVFTGINSNTPGQNLTQKQLYSANEIYKARQNKIKNYSLGPFIQDIFGLIPIKVSGLANGASYTEFGGTLQNQERVYFGPVNIRRMTIKLMNDKGETVDLNGSNWSFSFICEQLYKNDI